MEAKGLLDFATSPMGQGLLAAGFGGLAGANRNTPINNIGRAGLAGITGYTAASALGEQRKKREQAEQIKAAIPGLYGEDGTFDHKGYLGLGGSASDAKALTELPNAGRAKVARTMNVPGIDGQMTTIQLDDYGNKVGDGIGAYVAPQLVDTGDSKQFVTPRTGDSYAVGMSPSQSDASNRGWAGVQVRQDANQVAREANQVMRGGYSTEPLPPTAVKIQDEALGVIGSAGTLDQILAGKAQQIEAGELTFGPVSNVANNARNLAGLSSPESRNFASFRSDLERMRNESLRLNAGVQTDGDAQRAWNELFQNINDPELVKQRIQEIRTLNGRASELQRLRIDGVRTNYNARPYDFSQYDAQPTEQAPQAAQPSNAPQGGPQPGATDGNYRFKGGDPSDPASWEEI